MDAASAFKTVSLAHFEHSKRGLVGPMATPRVSSNLDVGSKLFLLADSGGLVWTVVQTIRWSYYQ